MTRLHRLGFGVLAAALFATCLTLAPPAGAAPVPFTDPGQRGNIGFCDRAGHEVRSGSIDSAPAVWIAASSTAAPDGYTKAQKAKASLFAYQPIKDVDPGDWSGKSLTAASDFTSDAHPMAAGTILDPALVDFVGAYPLKWDGLIQLRLIYSAPYKGLYGGGYPAAVIRVSGRTWTLLRGGGVACTAGTAKSVEEQRLPASAFKSPSRPSPVADVRKASAGSSSSSSTSSSGSNSADGGSSSSGATSGATGAEAGKSSGGSGGTIALIVVLCVLVAGGAGGYWFWRRPRATPR